MAATKRHAETRLAAGTMGLGLLLALGAPPARAQDAARMEAIERQFRSLQSELGKMRREMQAREAETRAAKQDAAQARGEARAAQQSAQRSAQPLAQQPGQPSGPQSGQRRLDTTPPAAAAVAQAETAPPAGQVRLGFPAGRPTITSADGRFEAFLGGQFQYDVGGAIQGNLNPGAPRLDSFGENLRRGRLFFGFKYDDLQLNLTPDFGGSPDGTVGLYEANLNWTPVKPLTLTLGYFKPWITLQDSMSSNDFLF